MSNFQVRVIGEGHNGTVLGVKSEGVNEIVVHITEPVSAAEMSRIAEGMFLRVRNADHADIEPSNLPRFLIFPHLRYGHSRKLLGDSEEGAPAKAPLAAELLFSLLAPKNTVDAELGDMQELFDRRVKTHGIARARMLYWSQVLRAVVPGIWRFVRKWGLVGFLIDYGRSKLGL